MKKISLLGMVVLAVVSCSTTGSLHPLALVVPAEPGLDAMSASLPGASFRGTFSEGSEWQVTVEAVTPKTISVIYGWESAYFPAGWRRKTLSFSGRSFSWEGAGRIFTFNFSEDGNTLDGSCAVQNTGENFTGSLKRLPKQIAQK
ncbi:MAG: hypothetical protein ABH835_00185 [Patescibacteria group bacterium]